MSQMSDLKKPGMIKRKVLSLAPEELISTSYLRPEEQLPLVIQPAVKDLNPIAWAKDNRPLIEKELARHGGLLFRNFNVRTVTEFENFIKALTGELLEYSYRSTPRNQVSGHIYTSTEYPPDQSIPLHNEMSYSLNWPMKIWFFCVQPSQQGGETPIGDSSRVYERISARTRERFMEKGVMYVRNYGEGVDLPWQQVFGKTSRAAVEDYCREAKIGFEWRGTDRLRTWQTCQAVETHPLTGKLVWFNQAHLFHISALGPEISASLLEEFGEANLPRNAYYGDGATIESDVLDEIREAYRQETVSFPWQEQDILMLDNMSVAHGRTPYLGARKVVVGMAEPFQQEKIEQR